MLYSYTRMATVGVKGFITRFSKTCLRTVDTTVEIWTAKVCHEIIIIQFPTRPSDRHARPCLR